MSTGVDLDSPTVGLPCCGSRLGWPFRIVGLRVRSHETSAYGRLRLCLRVLGGDGDCAVNGRLRFRVMPNALTRCAGWLLWPQGAPLMTVSVVDCARHVGVACLVGVGMHPLSAARGSVPSEVGRSVRGGRRPGLLRWRPRV